MKKKRINDEKKLEMIVIVSLIMALIIVLSIGGFFNKKLEQAPGSEEQDNETTFINKDYIGSDFQRVMNVV